MITLELDIPITRRAVLHTIRDDTGNLIRTEKKVSRIFDWLFTSGFHQFRLVHHKYDGTRTAYLMEFTKITEIDPD